MLYLVEVEVHLLVSGVDAELLEPVGEALAAEEVLEAEDVKDADRRALAVNLNKFKQ